MPNEKSKKRYTGKFKPEVVETMRTKKLSYCETARRFGTTDRLVCAWERIYLEEGPERLYIERRGRPGTAGGGRRGPKPKLSRAIEQDLIAEKRRGGLCRSQSAGTGFFYLSAKSEMDDRCYPVQAIRTQIISVTGS